MKHWCWLLYSCCWSIRWMITFSILIVYYSAVHLLEKFIVHVFIMTVESDCCIPVLLVFLEPLPVVVDDGNCCSVKRTLLLLTIPLWVLLSGKVVRCSAVRKLFNYTVINVDEHSLLYLLTFIVMVFEEYLEGAERYCWYSVVVHWCHYSEIYLWLLSDCYDLVLLVITGNCCCYCYCCWYHCYVILVTVMLLFFVGNLLLSTLLLLLWNLLLLWHLLLFYWWYCYYGGWRPYWSERWCNWGKLWNCWRYWMVFIVVCSGIWWVMMKEGDYRYTFGGYCLFCIPVNDMFGPVLMTSGVCYWKNPENVLCCWPLPFEVFGTGRGRRWYSFDGVVCCYCYSDLLLVLLLFICDYAVLLVMKCWHCCLFGENIWCLICILYDDTLTYCSYCDVGVRYVYSNSAALLYSLLLMIYVVVVTMYLDIVDDTVLLLWYAVIPLLWCWYRSGNADVVLFSYVVTPLMTFYTVFLTIDVNDDSTDIAENYSLLYYDILMFSAVLLPCWVHISAVRYCCWCHSREENCDVPCCCSSSVPSMLPTV